MKLIYFVLANLLSFSSYAMTIEQLANKRLEIASKQVVVSGIVSNIKYQKNKKNRILKFKLKSKFSKNYISVEYSLKLFNKNINQDPLCHEGQVAIVNGVFFGKNKGVKVGEIKIEKQTPLLCSCDTDFKKLDKELTVSDLFINKKTYNKKLVKVKGYITKLKIRKNNRGQKVSFTLVSNNKKLSLAVTLLIDDGKGKTINDFNCKLGQFITISGPLESSLKSKSKIGKMNIISKEYIECGSDVLELTAKEKQQNKKNIQKNAFKDLKKKFKKYKKIAHSTKKDAPRDQLHSLVKDMAQICKEYKITKFGLLCSQISSAVRTIELRNQLSFKIDSASKNMAGWADLKLFRLERKNSVLEIIKSLYPTDSDYIIGIPDRCYPDQQFNPSASNFPYRDLNVSQFAKDNFTAILNKFNDPALKCGNLMGSIYFIGNMDADTDLEIIKIDMKSPNLLKVIKSDI